MTHDIHIIGGGLAGSEAAWQLAEAGLKVRLSEMRGGGDTTPAHDSDRLAEMVCSNSFRSDDAEANAVGLLHQEMRELAAEKASALLCFEREPGGCHRSLLLRWVAPEAERIDLFA
jgi:tRNA:m(5)U-54 methyltransferase